MLHRLLGGEPPPERPPPRRIGRYQLSDKIGTGGMGVVYAATDAELGRSVALKLVKPRRGGAAARSRIMREARALASLSHPNIVEIYDVGRHEDDVYLAMELVQGRTLGDWRDEGERSWREIIGVYEQAAAGLAAAHAAGLVHRDFKPSNVLVGDDGRVRVLDFGLARRERPRHSTQFPTALVGSTISERIDEVLTRDDALVGTPAYMAPEQLLSAEVGPAADQFSFCVALYEALYGRRPFAAGTTRAQLASMLADRGLDRPRGRDVPAWLHDALARGLAVVPAHRHASMTALLAALRRDVTARRRRLALLGLVLAGLGVGLFAQATADSPASCDQRLEAAHNDAIAANLRGSGLSYADDAATRVVEGLDAYAAAWSAAAREACEQRASVPPRTADAMTHCLDDGKRRYVALVDLLGGAEADEAMVSNAVSAVGDLADPGRCTTVEYLDAEVRPPTDLDTQRRVAAIDEQIATADALLAAGKPAQALQRSQVAVAEATEAGYAPVLARALLVHAYALRHKRDPQTRREILRDAYYLAVGVGDDATAFDAALTHGSTLTESDPGEATWWFETARSVLSRVPSPAREGDLLRAECSVKFRLQEYDDAIATCRAGIAKLEEAYGTDDPRLAFALGTLGNVLRERRDTEEAVEVFKRSVQLREAAHGPEHPGVARALGNLGNAYEDLGRFDDALATMERGLKIQENAVGPEHLDVGKLLINIGRVRFKRGEVADALPLFERAAQIIEKRAGPNHPNFAVALTAVATGHTALGRHEEAIPVLLRVLAIQEAAVGPNHRTVARALSNLATVYSETGEHETALEYVQRSLDIYARTFGEDSPFTVEAILAAGRILERLGRIDEALTHMRRAVKIRGTALGAKHPEVGNTLADLGFLLANEDRCSEALPILARSIEILDATGPSHLKRGVARFSTARCTPNRKEARGFATAALEDLEAMGAGGEKPAALVRTWLATHR